MGQGKRNIHGLILAVCGVIVAGCTRETAAIDPAIISPSKIPGVIRSLPSYAPFALSGLTYYADRLYVSSNIGLIVVKGAAVEALYQWQKNDPVIEGPWRDLANSALWIQHASGGSLSRLDGIGWHHVPIPQPPSGSYTRGDALAGFLGVSSAMSFWMVGGGFASRWDSKSAQWISETQPPASPWSAVRAIGPIGDSLFYVVREGLEIIPPSPYSVYDRGRNWRPMTLKPMDFKQAVTTSNAIYVLAGDGTLVEVTAEGVTTVSTPGPCEAITLTSTGQLLAAFTGQGIFLLATTGSNGISHARVLSQWQQKAPYPYASNEGEHWGYVAEDDGKIAYATASVPHMGTDPGKWQHSGTTALWVLQSNRLQKLEFR